MSVKAKDASLPLNETLRDLALLRASDLQLASLFSVSSSEHAAPNMKGEGIVEDSVNRSYELAAEARKALAINNSGQLDKLGEAIEASRGKLDETLKGLDP